MTTEQAVDGVLNGHPEQFETIVSAHNELLYRIGMSYVNNHTEVEDLMQITYLKAYEKLDGFRQQSAFRTWITRIMINECLMYLRSSKRKMEISLDDNTNLLNIIIPDEDSISSKLDYEELKMISEKIIQKLPEDYRLVFVLRQVQNLSVKEVAEITELTEENIKVRLFRARRMLQKMLLNFMGENDVYSYHKKYCAVLTQKVMEQILQFKK